MINLKPLRKKEDNVFSLTDYELIDILNHMEAKHRKSFCEDIVGELKNRGIDPIEYWSTRYASLSFEQLVSIALDIQNSSSFQINAALRRIDDMIINNKINNDKFKTFNSILIDYRITRYNKFEKKINKNSKVKELIYRTRIILKMLKFVRSIFGM